MNEEENKSPNEANEEHPHATEGNLSSADLKELALRKKKKRFKTVLIIVIAALVLLYAVVNVTSWINGLILKNKQEEFEKILNKESITFYPENYDENIFENKNYMSLNRFVKYTNDAESYYFTEEDDLSKYSYELEFIADLMNKIIQGDAEGYNAAFADNYWDNNEDQYRERFTMQMLYNIEIEYIKSVTGDPINSDANGIFYYVNTEFKVSYMIYHNNGSFRTDVPEEAHVPVVYKLWAKYRPGILQPFEIKVYEVISYAKYQSGLYG